MASPRRSSPRTVAAAAALSAAVALAACGSSSSGAPASRPQTGAEIFQSAGCAGCHTLAAAGAHGVVGPNLDQLKPSYAAVVKQVTHGGGGMPAFAGQLTRRQITLVAAYVYRSTHGS
jgi:mono/diheme cytochrome c family protein